MSSNHRILIVDDDPLNVKLLAAILSSESYEIISALNGEQALKKANEEFPDLILIDGGKGQLNAAIKSLQSIAVKIPCASLAKENEEVFIPNKKNSIIIPKDQQALKILQHARDEAHRFGVAYNRSLRKLTRLKN